MKTARLPAVNHLKARYTSLCVCVCDLGCDDYAAHKGPLFSRTMSLPLSFSPRLSLSFWEIRGWELCFQSNELRSFPLPAFCIHTYESIHYNPPCTIAFLPHRVQPARRQPDDRPPLSARSWAWDKSSSLQTEQEVRLAQQWRIYQSVHRSINWLINLDVVSHQD